MKIRLLHKLIALLLLSGVLPLIAVSLLLISVGRKQVETTVQQVHRLEADAAATSVARFVQQSQNRLKADLEGSIEAMVDADIRQALIWMIGKSDNLVRFRVLRVFDGEGLPMSEPLHLPPESIPAEHQDSFLVLPGDVAEFSRNVPLKAALETGETQLSAVYLNGRRREALVAMAVPLKDHFREVRWVVAGELSLREVQSIVADVTVGSVGYAYLVDAQGRAIAHPEFNRVLAGASLSGNGIVEKAQSAHQPGAVSFTSTDGVPQLGAYAPVFWGGWQLVVQQPEADAYRPVKDMKLRATYILLVALAASLACGWLHVRSLVGPLREGHQRAMRRIVDGQFGHRLEVKTTDEVGELAGAFNVVGRVLQKFKDEIETWNRELQARVDTKTKALESAQAQLIQSAKLSAVGQLGAGVAHELDDPLAGVVGQAALLKRRLRRIELPAEEREKLESYVQHIETESSRCREIIHGLLSFSQGSGGKDAVDVNASIEKLLILVQSNARTASVSLKADLTPGIPQVEGNEQQVQQVVMHVLSNALQATPAGGSVVVRTRRRDDGVIIEVEDTGRGIAPEHIDKVFDPFFTTKEVWQSTGLGLSVCHSIVESHGGHIDVKSELGKGSTFSIVLPARTPTGETRKASVQEPGGLRRTRQVPAGVR